MTDLKATGLTTARMAPIFSGAPTVESQARELPSWPTGDTACGELHPGVGEVLRTVYASTPDPDDPLSLRDTYLDLALGGPARPTRRVADDEEILGSRAVIRFAKELFNYYFRDDLYGRRRDESNIVLSSGSVDEGLFGLCESLKDCVRYALDRDWYGYSDSRGRLATRQAIAQLENRRVTGSPYDERWISVTLGGTLSVFGLADFLLSGTVPGSPVLCGIPNYPPLVEAFARRAGVRMVPTPCGSEGTDIGPLIEAVRPDTPVVFVQTVTNPTGTAVPEQQLEQLLARCGPQTTLVLDEAHECLGPDRWFAAVRADRRVIRVTSLSKDMSVPGLKAGWLVGHPDFIAEWYEYASTSMGGPPSVFYLLLEAAARFESWRLGGVEDPRDLVSEWSEYDVPPDLLAMAYGDFLRQRLRRERILRSQRNWMVGGLVELGYEVVPAGYSINVAASPPGAETSYGWWARTLDASSVSVYPGILSFCFDDRWVRFTSSIPAEALSKAISRLPYHPTADELL